MLTGQLKSGVYFVLGRIGLSGPEIARETTPPGPR
jgi:hypothetical protein